MNIKFGKLYVSVKDYKLYRPELFARTESGETFIVYKQDDPFLAEGTAIPVEQFEKEFISLEEAIKLLQKYYGR